MSNRNWWPNQPNLQVLYQPSPRSDPMGENFNYAEEFKILDVEALKRDIIEVMTTRYGVPVTTDPSAPLWRPVPERPWCGL
jgi:catalase (peroxidase I)